MSGSIDNNLLQGRGHIGTIILKTLYEGDRYGYDIIKEIEQRSHGQFKLKQPSLYSALNRLENDGFIKSYWGAQSKGGRRKYFTLTDAGKEIFIKHQSEWEYSRTVIDKLISDQDYDLSALPPKIDEIKKRKKVVKNIVENPSEAIVEIAEENKIQSPLEEERIDGQLVSDEEFIRQMLEENTDKKVELDLVDSDVKIEETIQPEQEQKFVAKEQKYLDTASIMNDLYNKYSADETESYSNKLITEKYIPVPLKVVSSQTYFNDNLDEDYMSANFGNIKNQNTVGDTTPAPPIDINDYTPTEKEIQDDIDEQSPQSYDEEYGDLGNAADESMINLETNSSENINKFYDYDSDVVGLDERKMVSDREYKNILGKLVNKETTFSRLQNADLEKEKLLLEADEVVINGIENKKIITENNNEAKEIHRTVGSKVQLSNIDKWAETISNSGDGIKIRTHNSDTTKEFNTKYYYYANKLMLNHYAILFAFMLIEVVITFLFLKIGLKITQKYDMIMYLSAIIISLLFPTVAFFVNLFDPNKKKRINFSLKNSMIFRFIVMLQLFVIIYCLNIAIFNTSFIITTENLVSVILPAVLCLNLPISAMIFNALHQSKKYAVE